MNATSEVNYIDDFSKIDAVIERVTTIKETVGKNFKIAVDFHGRLHKGMTCVLAGSLNRIT